MSDILTRLLLNTGDYDSKLAKAKKSSNDFAAGIGGKAVKAVGKFAAGIGVAMGAAEAFGKMIHSTQTTSDAWNNTINACKGSVDMFFQSLSSGDWSNFEGGLLRTIGRLKEVAVLQDMLGDAKLSMGFDVREFEREYVRLEGIINNETLGKAEREMAFKDMQTLIADFKKRVEATGKGAAETLVKELNARFNQDFTLEDVKTYIKEVNNEFLNTETLQRLNEYKATLAKFKPGGSMAVDGGYVLTEKQYKERHADLEKLRLLQEDNDENRKRMVSDYEYVLQMQQKADEYHKRSLEKQTKIAGLNKSASGGGKGKNEKALPVYVDGLNYQSGYGNKVLKWMNGEEVPVIKAKIEIEEEVVDEEDIAAKFTADLEKKAKSVEDMNSALQSTADIFGSLGSIAGSAGNDFLAATMNSMGSIAQMILQLQALSTAQGVGSASKLPFPANLAAIATVVATIASVFSSLPKFADGGIVGGSSYFGDKLLARVNSGEMILNQQQQARALSLMDGGRDVRVSGDVRLSGKDIYISLRNYMAASGAKF